MILFRARVSKATGRTVHMLGTIGPTGPEEVEPMPPIHAVEIERREKPLEGVFLVYLDENGARLTDTWHRTVRDAMDQAAFEFELAESDWTPVTGV